VAANRLPMAFFVLVAVLLVVGIGLRLYAPRVGRGARLRTFGPPVAAVLIVLTAVLSSVHVIAPGHTGLVYELGTSGQIVGHTGSGIVFTLPWQGVRQVSTQTQKQDFQHVVGFSKETQEVDFDVALNYHVDPRSIDIAPNREAIRRRLQEQLRRELSTQGVVIDNVSITNISFSQRFTSAIENKQEATQLAQAAQARVAQRKAEADQRVAIARGDAEATLVRARAQAQANKLLQAALTPEFIDYQRVLALQKLATSPNIQLVPSNAFFTVPDSIRTRSGSGSGP
jgi:regulator of protease activity HflC (stomatin/prohibitin superfamily)